MGPEPDADLELALSLHRELNGLTRRSRQPSREAALGALKKRRGEEKPSTTSSGSGSKRRSGGGSEEKSHQRPKKLQRDSSSEGGSDLSDPSSPHGSRPGQQQQQPQQADHHSSDRKAARSTQQTDASAQQLQSSSLAAAAAARSKAAKAGGAANGLPPHVKCFFAGVRWGTLLPPSALKDRASLVAAVSKAFEQDGVRCSEQSAHVIFVTADQQTLEFPGRHKLGDLPRPGEWDAAARRAVRIYVR